MASNYCETICISIGECIDTTAEQQLFNSVTTDTQTVEEQLRSYQAAIASASAIDAFDGLKESVDSFAEYQTTVQEALTTGQLTIEQYESLIAIAPEYADALEMQGQQITLNAEKTQELVEARNDEIAADVKAQRSNARVAYIRNSAVLEDLIDKYNKLSSVERQSHDGVALAEQIDNLLAEQTELSNTIDKYALLESQLSEVAQAYKNYEAAINYASPEDHWEIGFGAVEDLNEGLNSGKMGTAEFQAALDLAIPDDVYKDLETEAEQAQAVTDYVSNVLNPFFTEDEVTGMQRFLDEAVKLGALEKSFDENGVAEYATKLWENLLVTVAFAEGPIYEKVAMDHNGIVTVPGRVLQRITPDNRLGKIIFTGTAPNIRRITVDLPYRVLGPSDDADLSKLYAQWPVFNAQTHYDFPSVGYPNVIYKAESEHMLYQWIDSENRYDPLTTGSSIDNVTLINGGDAYGNA